MPHYISLFRFTRKGIENTKQGPTRLDAAKKALDAAGGKALALTFADAQNLTPELHSLELMEESCEK